MKDMVTEQKKKKTMMQLAFSVESCLLIRKQRTGWDKCMNVGEGSRGHVQGLVIELTITFVVFLMSNKAKPTTFTFHTVVD